MRHGHRACEGRTPTVLIVQAAILAMRRQVAPRLEFETEALAKPTPLRAYSGPEA